LLLTEATAISEVVLGKLRPSCSITQDIDRAGDIDRIGSARSSVGLALGPTALLA
jgi:hypothetical protein